MLDLWHPKASQTVLDEDFYLASHDKCLVRLQDTNAILQPFLENVETLREACLDKKDAAGKVLLVSGILPDTRVVHVFAKLRELCGLPAKVRSTLIHRLGIGWQGSSQYTSLGRSCRRMQKSRCGSRRETLRQQFDRGSEPRIRIR